MELNYDIRTCDLVKHKRRCERNNFRKLVIDFVHSGKPVAEVTGFMGEIIQARSAMEYSVKHYGKGTCYVAIVNQRLFILRKEVIL